MNVSLTVFILGFGAWPSDVVQAVAEAKEAKTTTSINTRGDLATLYNLYGALADLVAIDEGALDFVR